jgi:BlaI family transcriptional regulator, penicillinase repressor
MARTSKDITDAELSILQLLWEQGTATVRTLTPQLYGDPSPSLSLYATVQKLLQRLEAKKCVARNRKVWPHKFTATLKREELIARQLQTTADKLCEGELEPLLTCLVKVHGLSAADRESLRGLLDELDRSPKKKKKQPPQ